MVPRSPGTKNTEKPKSAPEVQLLESEAMFYGISLLVIRVLTAGNLLCADCHLSDHSKPGQ